MAEQNKKVVSTEVISLERMEAGLGDLSRFPKEFTFDMLAITDKGYQVMVMSPALRASSSLGSVHKTIDEAVKAYVEIGGNGEHIRPFCLDLRGMALTDDCESCASRGSCPDCKLNQPQLMN